MLDLNISEMETLDALSWQDFAKGAAIGGLIALIALT